MKNIRKKKHLFAALHAELHRVGPLVTVHGSVSMLEEEFLAEVQVHGCFTSPDASTWQGLISFMAEQEFEPATCQLSRPAYRLWLTTIAHLASDESPRAFHTASLCVLAVHLLGLSEHFVWLQERDQWTLLAIRPLVFAESVKVTMKLKHLRAWDHYYVAKKGEMVPLLNTIKAQ